MIIGRNHSQSLQLYPPLTLSNLEYYYRKLAQVGDKEIAENFRDRLDWVNLGWAAVQCDLLEAALDHFDKFM